MNRGRRSGRPRVRLGWMLREARGGRRVAEHTGSIAGFQSLLRVSVERGRPVAKGGEIDPRPGLGRFGGVIVVRVER